MAGEVGCSLEETRAQPSSLGRPKTRRQTAWSGGGKYSGMTVEFCYGSRSWKAPIIPTVALPPTHVSKADIASVVHEQWNKNLKITHIILHAK